MNVSEYIKNGNLKVRVKPNAPKTEIDSYDEVREELVVKVAAVPDKGKANKELINFLSKKLNKRVFIRAGETSRTKLLSVQ